MNSSYVNMGLGALLATLFVLKSVSLVSGALFASEPPEKPGFIIVADETAPAGGASGKTAAAAPETPIAQLLQKADAKVGETIFKKCQACHDGSKGGPNKVGPNLYGIVDRPIAAHEGFGYSAAIKDFSKGSSEKWTYDHLTHFLAAPKKYIPGTAMGFAGLPKETDRANVIAYLRTLADTPAPLPDAAAAPAPATN
ncbi:MULTISPECIES: c-type cytochrome [unclassified Rhizobium]|uniref:c-type cytochrome n=1 Tax=unclassified Rhizobium TaxID=2613769 RepID=UPI001ADBC2BB|nr:MULTISPECIES: cytochrome c family protein [unclassified Rhizobium]MBO9096639.1 cytochrome c family protein [Rhizobium sp. L58/93]MBO9136397.1 cytochrome c family protein [Rhizobium sp. B209b/85]MBO9166895.1 cytochrome c family protein [Rhizobium sp. L245/93]QXZ82652.1 cytochrome c family protein [Rhizobium sp. K1/93]QXZ89835.1 cytochrome c family protein [Rhizobium sp. K15/93]